MKKITASLLIVLMFICSLNGLAIARENEVKVYLDGILMEFDVQPQIFNGRTMVPMRKIFEEMGMTVHWLNEDAYQGEQKILATKGTKGIWLQIGNPELHIVQDILSSNNENDVRITLDVPPQIIDGRTLVPLRAVAESFDAVVDWDEKNFSVQIITSIEDNSLEVIKAKDNFIIGCDDSFPPMTFKDESGNFVGFDVDLARAVANKLGVKLEVKPISRDAKELALNSKKIDAIWSGMTITSERKERILFSEPYITNPQVFIVKNDSAITVKQNLMGKTIGYQSGSSSEEIYKKNPESNSFLVNTKSQTYQDLNSAISALTKGEIEAVLVDKITAQNITKDSSSYRLIDGEYVDDIEDWGVGFRLNDKTLRDTVQKALDDMFSDGSYEKIYEKWFGTDTLIQYTNTYENLFGTRSTKKFSLLNNRLQVYLPEFSQDVAIQSGIMSPWSSSDEETRIIIEKDNRKLVLYLYELFVQTSDNITMDAQTILISEYESDGTLKSPTTNGKVQNIQLIPNTYEGKDGITVREAIIKTQDDLLVHAVVLAAPETFNDNKDECIEIAENMIDSIYAGERVIERSQRTGYIGWPGLNISLKQDYVLICQRGIDFDVYYVQKIVKPGEVQPYMGLYVGGHPAFSAEDSTVSTDGKILGQDIKWYFNKETKKIDSDTTVDALVEVNNEDYPLYMHIFVHPYTESAWNEFKQMSESLSK